ncbi:MAG TPA: cytochrome d ubiquinol oxidase subunit II [Alphaproteobacteria bacterium]
MFSFASWLDLPLIWSGIVAIAVFLYVLLDGFDLGVGMLFPFAPTHECRDKMMNSVAPFWDGNETWLVMGGGGLLIAFPTAFAIIMPAIYIPLIVMLIALIFRGVAFEFRYKADRSRFVWDTAFHFGSLIATFMQGIILGTFVQGIPVTDQKFSGGAVDWLEAFPLFCGVALVVGYSLIGATWLVKKTDGETKAWAQKCALYLLPIIMVLFALVSLWVPFLDDAIAQRWFAGHNMLYLAPLPLVSLFIAYKIYRGLKADYDYQPFFLTMGLFLCAYLGLAISLWPYIVPRSVTIWDAASPGETLSLLLVGTVIVLPVVLLYTLYVYWVFRGKVDAKGYYSDH